MKHIGESKEIAHSTNKIFGSDAARLLLIATLAAVVRFVPAVLYQSYFDIGSYNIPWAIYGARDPFGIYGPLLAEFGMDYPPLFPFALTFFGEQILWGRMTDFWQMEMFYVKLIPVVADICLTALVYLVAWDMKAKRPWLVALMWALNPAAIYNCAFWGQADCILLFFLLAMGWLLWKQQPELAAVAFALGCLSKLQMCYYAPVLLLGFLVMRAKPWRWLTALAAGGIVGFLGWLPFMRRGEWLRLPLRIYFGGTEKYPFINMQAANVFALGDFYSKPDSAPMVGSITFLQFSIGMTCLAVAGLIAYGVLVVLRRNTTLSVFAVALVYADIIFLFTTRQHERYQLPVLALTLLCWLQTRQRPYALLFCAYSLLTFANQFVLLTGETIKPLYEYIAPAIAVLALCNLALFGYLLWHVICTLHSDWQQSTQNKTAAVPHSRKKELVGTAG